MGLLDKAKAAAEEAAIKAKETAEELQTKRELGQAYGELGRKAFALVESGELSAPELDPTRRADPHAQGAARRRPSRRAATASDDRRRGERTALERVILRRLPPSGGGPEFSADLPSIQSAAHAARRSETKGRGKYMRRMLCGGPRAARTRPARGVRYGGGALSCRLRQVHERLLRTTCRHACRRTPGCGARTSAADVRRHRPVVAHGDERRCGTGGEGLGALARRQAPLLRARLGLGLAHRRGPAAPRASSRTCTRSRRTRPSRRR